MNFFQAQDKARKHTSRLILLFILAVVCLIALTNILFIGIFSYSNIDEATTFSTAFKNSYDKDLVIAVSLGVALLIALGSVYKIILLSKGGHAIAEMLGGKVVSQSTREPKERRLLNVVEEMSIASGIPIPQVYLLEEASINAFAAGQSHNNAVIGITRGSLKHLSRDELQGVIAHEFSHILNGDMRLNLRLMGVLHGILLIGIIGENIIDSMRYSSRSSKNNGGGLFIIGLGLFAIGYAGTFFGKWIKASISRQREYLADASAVQFTRDKDTIAGALKKIGGLNEGSIIKAPSASEYSHAYFSDGITNLLSSLFSTHPPLETRIKRVDPGWDGRFILSKPISDKKIKPAEIKQKKRGSIAGVDVSTVAILTAAQEAINQTGIISKKSIQHAHEIINEISDELKTASQSPYSARAVVYTLLIREQKDKSKAWNLLKKYADPNILPLTKNLLENKTVIEEKLILPLLELCINSLRELSLDQYKTFKETIENIIKSDATIDLHEWIIQRLVTQQLDLNFMLLKPAKEKHAYLGAVKNDAEIIFSLIAYIEHKEDKQLAKQAFEAGIKEIGASALEMIEKEELSLDNINNALDELMQLKPLQKPKILKACAKIILYDKNSSRRGTELLKIVSLSLDCPAPPLY